MNKLTNAFLCSLVLVGGILAAGCPKKPKPAVTVKTNTEPTAPTVSMVTPTETVAPVIKPPEDFVRTDPKVDTDVLPVGIEDLNKYVRDKGYIADAMFDYDASTLSADAQAALTRSAQWLTGKDGKIYNLLVEGHCDERGTEQYNLALGDRRANTAKEYLATLGVDASRIRTVSYGEERPFDPGHDESAYAKNRRAHLVLVR